MLAGLLSLLASFAVSSRALDTVQYGAFTQTATYSIANQLDFFTSNDLAVIYDQVPNSTAAFASLLSGQYDILTATVDNALNYRFNQGQNVTVLGQLDQGPDLVVASVPSITTFQQLKGKPIIVDSPVSGYAYLLQDVLEANGLLLGNGDYYFMTVGATSTRYEALINAQLSNGTAVYATILTYPFTGEGEALPASQRPNILERISALVSPVTSTAFCARQSSLSNATETARLVKFVESMYAANRYLLNPTNKRCAIEAIAKQLNVSQTLAAAEYAAVLNKTTGEVSPGGDFTVNQRGILNDVEVRKKFGGFGGVPADFDFKAALRPAKGGLIDYEVRNAAVEGDRKKGLRSNCSCG